MQPSNIEETPQRSVSNDVSLDVATSPSAPSLRRFLVLMIFSLLTASNAMQWITFSPVPTQSKSAFSLTTDQLNFLSSIFMIVFVATFFMSCSVFERWNLKTGILVGAVFNALGSAVRVLLVVLFPGEGYALTLTAQCLASLGQIFFLATPPLLASQWFPHNERAVATAVGSMANNLGTATGMFLPPMLVVSGSDNATPHDFLALFLLQGALCVGLVLLVVFFVPSDAPMAKPQEQSRTESAQSFTAVCQSYFWQTVDVFATIREMCCRNRDFLFLLICFSVSIGSVWTISSVLAQILAGFAISDTSAGGMGALNFVVGTCAAYLVGKWVDAKRFYKTPLVVANFMNILIMSALALVLLSMPEGDDPEANADTLDFQLGNALVFALYVLAGCAQNSVIPLAFEFAMEVTYPLPSSVPGAVLMAGGNAVSLVLLSLSSSLLGAAVITSRENALKAISLLVCVGCCGSLFAFATREKLRRKDSEARDALA